MGWLATLPEEVDSLVTASGAGKEKIAAASRVQEQLDAARLEPQSVARAFSDEQSVAEEQVEAIRDAGYDVTKLGFPQSLQDVTLKTGAPRVSCQT